MGVENFNESVTGLKAALDELSKQICQILKDGEHFGRSHERFSQIASYVEKPPKGVSWLGTAEDAEKENVVKELKQMEIEYLRMWQMTGWYPDCKWMQDEFVAINSRYKKILEGVSKYIDVKDFEIKEL